MSRRPLSGVNNDCELSAAVITREPIIRAWPHVCAFEQSNPTPEYRSVVKGGLGRCPPRHVRWTLPACLWAVVQDIVW